MTNNNASFRNFLIKFFWGKVIHKFIMHRFVIRQTNLGKNGFFQNTRFTQFIQFPKQSIKRVKP